MDTHFTIMIKENDTTNLKLLTEKLNEGYYLNDRIEVGRSTVLTLRKPEEQRNRRNRANLAAELMADINRVSIDTEPVFSLEQSEPSSGSI